MDLRALFLKYSTAVNLLIVTLIAYFLADGINTYVAGKFMAGTVKAEVSVDAGEAARAPFTPDIDAIARRDLFGSVAPVQPADGGTAAGPGGMTVTDLRLDLVGIYYFGLGDPHNIATITKIRDQETALFMAGSTVTEDAVLAEIQWDRVVLLRTSTGAREELRLDDNAPVTSPDQPAGGDALAVNRGRPGAAVNIDFSSIEMVRTNQYVIPKELLEQILQPENMNAILQQAKTIPTKKQEGDKEVIDGFRIYRIRPGSLYQRLGLQNGDVIKSVNNQKLDNYEAAMGLWTNLKNQQSFSLEVERQGTSQEYVYEVK
jgi:general secretion pathway protein C